MKIVFLDRKTIGDDLDLSKFSEFGEVVTYGFSAPEEVPERVADADIIILNKVPVNEQTIGKATNLKLVCVTATGTNNLDKDYLASRGIAWRNVAGYSTETVAQHTFAMLFYVYENLAYYDNYVKSGAYQGDKLFTHFDKTFYEINGKKWGIIGLGAIGKRVAEIATCFGADVQYYSTSGRNHDLTYKEVDFDTLLATSDVISIHAPLTDATLHLIDKATLGKMKSSAILINVGRGPIIVENDLRQALDQNLIRAAALDVLDVEPMAKDSPFAGVSDSTKLFITPHIAWASVEARNRCMSIIYNQVSEFVKSLV